MSRAEKLEQAKSAIESSRTALTEKTKTDQSQLKLSGFPEVIESIKGGGTTITLDVSTDYNDQTLIAVSLEDGSEISSQVSNGKITFEGLKEGRYKLKTQDENIIKYFVVSIDVSDLGDLGDLVFLKQETLNTNFNDIKPTKIVFTDIKAPDNIETIDCSRDNDNSVVKWYDETTTTLYVSSQNSGTKIELCNACPSPTNSSQKVSPFFYHLDTVTEINFDNIDTSLVTDMSNYFLQNYLEKLDLSNFNTSQVTNMEYMFNGSNKLQHLDVRPLNTSKVTDMKFMFSNSEKLKTINLLNFNTSQVTNMRWMFAECPNLTELDISSFDLNNIKNMCSMLRTRSALSTVKMPNSSTDSLEDASFMFGYSNYTNLDLSNFNMSKVTTVENMFCVNRNLTKIIANDWTYNENVKNSPAVFSNCTSLPNFDSNKRTGEMCKPVEQGGYFTSPDTSPDHQL